MRDYWSRANAAVRDDISNREMVKIRDGLWNDQRRDGRSLRWFRTELAGLRIGLTARQLDYAARQGRVISCVRASGKYDLISSDQLLWLALLLHLYRKEKPTGEKKLHARFHLPQVQSSYWRLRTTPFPAELVELLEREGVLSHEQLAELWDFSKQLETPASDKRGMERFNAELERVGYSFLGRRFIETA